MRMFTCALPVVHSKDGGDALDIILLPFFRYSHLKFESYPKLIYFVWQLSGTEIFFSRRGRPIYHSSSLWSCKSLASPLRPGAIIICPIQSKRRLLRFHPLQLCVGACACQLYTVFSAFVSSRGSGKLTLTVHIGLCVNNQYLKDVYIHELLFCNKIS